MNDLIQSVPEKQMITPVLSKDKFQDKLDDAKLNLLEEASIKDPKFIKEMQEQLKEAALKSAQLEKEKQQLEKQAIQYHEELLETQQKLNKHSQDQNYWDNRQKKREYHYNGVKPIMVFVNITEPMNLFVLYLLTSLLLPFYLISKFLKGTVGVLISGADSKDRSAGMKGFMWTLLAIFTVLVLALIVYLGLDWLNLINGGVV